MDKCYLYCIMNLLELPTSRIRLLVSSLMQCFVSVFSSTWGNRDVLVCLEKCYSWYIRPSFFSNKSAVTLSQQHLGKTYRHTPLGPPIQGRLIFVLCEALCREGCNVWCLKWKAVSWGITKHTGTVFDFFALVWGAVLLSVWRLSLAAGFSPP